MVHKAVAIEHGMRRAGGQRFDRGVILYQLFLLFRCAVGRMIMPKLHDCALDLERDLVSMLIRSTRVVLKAAGLVSIEVLVPHHERNAELATERCQLLALEETR